MADAETCANIGPRQRRRRLLGGLALWALTIAAAGALVMSGLPRYWRLLLIVPAMGAGLGVFQATASTCVALAARGLRNMDDGDQKVESPGDLSRMRRQSRVVYIKSTLAAIVITAVALAF